MAGAEPAGTPPAPRPSLRGGPGAKTAALGVTRCCCRDRSPLSPTASAGKCRAVSCRAVPVRASAAPRTAGALPASGPPHRAEPVPCLAPGPR